MASAAAATSRRAQQPDHLGLLFLKERARRRLSNFVEGPVKRDVSGSATLRRRLSNSLDTPRVVKYYFELSGHVLKWWEEFGPGRDERGMISLLSCSGVRDLTREERASLPTGTKGGFCISDAASDLIARRGDTFLYSDNLADMNDWIAALRSAFAKFHVNPMAGLGPLQAATEKPIIEGDLLSRDTHNGIPQSTWTKLTVSLYDNRIECRRPNSQSIDIIATTPIVGTLARRKSLSNMAAERNNSNGILAPASGVNSPPPSAPYPPCRVEKFTVNFYVGDSRVASHAFLVSDLLTTHYFAAEDDMQKLFWMQTIAKTIRNLVSMHEHAFKVRETLATTNQTASNPVTSPGRNKGSDDEDDEDDEEDEHDDQEKLDAKRPPQVRRESMRRFYGLGLSPADELSTPPEAQRRKSLQQRGDRRADSDDDDGDDSDDNGSNSSSGRRVVIKLQPVKPVLATPPEHRLSFKAGTSRSSPSKPSPVKAVTTTAPVTPLPVPVNSASTSSTATEQKNSSPPIEQKTQQQSSSTHHHEGKLNLAQTLSKMGSSGGALNPRAIASRLSTGKHSKDSPTTLAVFNSLDTVSSKWVEGELAKLTEVALRVSGNKSSNAKSTRITFKQLVQGWGDEHSDDLGGLLLRAKRAGVAHYDGDMLFADYDDDVMIDIVLPKS